MSEAEREMVYAWCRRLDLPLWSPPRTPEAIDTLGREVERLRDVIARASRLAESERADLTQQVLREA